jgi:protein subunit release factor A
VNDSDVTIELPGPALKAGGQHTGPYCCAIKATHTPTGLSVTVDSERSQHANRVKAMEELREIVFANDRAKTARGEAFAAAKALAAGSNEISARVIDAAEAVVMRELLAKLLKGGMEEYWRLVEAEVKL